jgi:hypothetical protein
VEISKHQVRFLETLMDHGIRFFAGHTHLGEFTLHPSEMEAFINRPEEFAAQKMGVAFEQYKAWSDFISSWQCLGTAKDGQRCKGRANYGFRVTAKNYGPSNENCYCPKHKAQVNVWQEQS